MALGDGIRRNIAHVEPTERAALRDAFVELNHRFFLGSRTDPIPGGVSWWFKQDEIHQGTHVHGGPEFLPWHREIVNRLEELLRQINPQLSLHYWDWTQDPRSIPNANLGGGTTGTLNLFTPDFMGYGGSTSAPIGEPWASAGYYVPSASQHRDATNNPADPPQVVNRFVSGSPASAQGDIDIVGAGDFATMRGLLENVHNAMHGFVAMGGQHISFRDPFVFLLHSNVDRLFARWQTDPAHPERLEPTTVYGSESGSGAINSNVQPWSGGIGIRPWDPPESQGVPHDYKHPSIVFPPCYDTNQGPAAMVEVRNPGTPPVVSFNSVPAGSTAVRAATFRVYGCNDVTVRVKAGAGPAAPFSVLSPASGSVTVPHGTHLAVDARIWIAFTAGAAGVSVPDQTVTFESPETGDEYQFTLRATVIERPTVAVMLALDQSGSMAWDAGTSGATRLQVLKDAARKFMELVPEGSGVGLVRFDHDSYAVDDPTYPGLPVTRINSNDMFDPGRVAAIAAVNDHETNPAGNTSVGDGVDRARGVLNAVPAGEYQHKALVVLTDGLENAPLSIADVTGSIDDRTFAIGLGNEHQVNTAALTTLAGSTGGYLLLTGLLSSSLDDYFRLSKYFMQILAGVLKTEVVVDPSGYIAPGTTIRVPFAVSETDIECTAILMTDQNVVDLAIEAPDGTVIDAAAAPGLGIDYGVGEQTRHFRFTLPVGIGSGQRAGTWHALLEVDRAAYKKTLTALRRALGEGGEGAAELESFATHGARYSVLVHATSDLKMDVTVEQSGYEPGAEIVVQAVLTEYDLPVERRAVAEVLVTRPGGTTATEVMSEEEPGIFRCRFQAASSGLYHLTTKAHGATFRGTAFTREQVSTAAVWRGRGEPSKPEDPRRPGLGDLLACLIEEGVISRDLIERWREQGLDLEGIRRCWERSGESNKR